MDAELVTLGMKEGKEEVGRREYKNTRSDHKKLSFSLSLSHTHTHTHTHTHGLIPKKDETLGAQSHFPLP